MRFLYLIILCLYFLKIIKGEVIEREDRSSKRYCLQLTWLGPRYENDSQILKDDDEESKECTTFLNNYDKVPCRQPFVVSYDGSPPDLWYLWNVMRDNVKGAGHSDITCTLRDGDVCAKYTHFYNGVIMNVTYMCTKAYVENEGAIEKGCFTQDNKGRKVEVCLCKSFPGDEDMPCNRSYQIELFNILIILSTAATVLFNTFYKIVS